MSLFSDVELEPAGDFLAETFPKGIALVVFYRGEGLVLAWQARGSLEDGIREAKSGGDGGFRLDDFDHEPQPDGVYVARFAWVDDGPSDWDSRCREWSVGLRDFRPATEEEWKAHRDEEWPWDPTTLRTDVERDAMIFAQAFPYSGRARAWS